jgi:hypothetical protein
MKRLNICFTPGTVGQLPGEPVTSFGDQEQKRLEVL